ncbi:hypothetical protein PSCICM_21580 [Pseudomonas cichorii]|uniref:Uncharacterized protein n=1 Tax=Pseudomonas cichorii TaxID=36746 RepID=A0ABQ1DN37_PSECI|nr:hypothetical protein PSCICM_21580 [Pseudomonas cichorii]GFM92426.1 hypothetical protein PSCICP_23980 [Pseudomonas cichorii]
MSGRAQANNLGTQFNRAFVAVMRDMVQGNMNRHGVPPAAWTVIEPRKTYAMRNKACASDIEVTGSAKHSTRIAPIQISGARVAQKWGSRSEFIHE